jgi:predicted ABC-type ATPase
MLMNGQVWGRKGVTMSERKIIIIAGPNGAGNNTFVEEFLPKGANCYIFVNGWAI